MGIKRFGVLAGGALLISSGLAATGCNESDSATGPDGAGGDSRGGTGLAAGESGGGATPLGGGGNDGSPPPLALPSAAFAIDGFGDWDDCESDLDPDPCNMGPWVLGLRETEDGVLEGALVSLDPTSSHRPAASAVRLVREDGDTFVPAGSDPSIVIKRYRPDYETFPTACLTKESKLTLLDDDDDGVADRVQLSGRYFSQGERGGSYDSSCDSRQDFARPLAAVGRAIEEPVVLQPHGDALHPRLALENGFLLQGGAALEQPSAVDATPLEAGGLIYGFEAASTLTPGAMVSWRVDAESYLGVAPQAPSVDLQVEDWLTLDDASFEAFEADEVWPDGRDARIRSSIDLGRVADGALPAIAGEHSFELARGGSYARMRLARANGATTLSFLAASDIEPASAVDNVPVEVEVGVIGQELAPAPLRELTREPADCAIYADFCAAAGAGVLYRYTVELDDAEGDLLVTIHNAGLDFGVSPKAVWLDELKLEP
ncbi:MAG: hypothetical protein K0R38_3537 [Polyangiaceae bacterium]|jgi:hypothetical protein|nr:hypothetical protein [Polyangiaceae bacterium]